jgi:large subunit ribosomal protein L10
MEAVATLRGKFGRARTALLADHRGMTVAELEELRAQLRRAAVELRVVKNSLARRAVADLPYRDGLAPHLDGPTTVAFGYDDPAAASRIVMAFRKSRPTFVVKAAMVEGRVVGPADVAALAELPSRQLLLGRLGGLLRAPLGLLASGLRAPVRALAVALTAVAAAPGRAAGAPGEQG